MIDKAKYKFQKGDTLRYIPTGMLCTCLSIDEYGDTIYVLGEEQHAKGSHKFMRYEEDKWEKVDDSTS